MQHAFLRFDDRLYKQEVKSTWRLTKAPIPDSKERLQRMIAQYGNALQRMCYVYLRDAALAEDAVQETFLKVYRHLDAFRGESSEKTWLMHIAVNTCRDMRRNAWFRYVDRRITLEDVHMSTVPPDADSIALITEVAAAAEKKSGGRSASLLSRHEHQGNRRGAGNHIFSRNWQAETRNNASAHCIGRRRRR
jgi:RNA polymerase sigma factor (sigma-70 family)